MRFFDKWKLPSTALILVVSAYFTLALNWAFFKQVFTLQPFNAQPSDYFLLTIPLVYFVALNIILNLLSLPFLHKIIIPLLLIISAAISYNSLFFNIYFDADMLTNVLQTNFAESSRMLTASYLLWISFLGVIPAVIYIFIRIEYKIWWKEILARISSVLISLFVIVAVGKFYYQDYASFFRNHKTLPHLITPSNFVAASVKKIRHYYRDNLPYQQLGLDAQQEKPDTYRHVTVIVLGETTRAQNWGLNGYARQTTPRLSARGEQVINFHNVSSCGTATAVSVPCMFSTMTKQQYSGGRAYKQDNLLDILQRAGIDILWLNNNSDCKGVCERVPSKDILELNLPEFCHNGECLDNILLPELDKALQQSSSRDLLVVLHTMGSHGPTYYERYTSAERVFTPTCDTNEINRCSNEALVNTYDNGIVYLDQFLDQIISKLEQHSDWESALYYVSDHGESLGENGLYLHGAPYSIAPDYQTKVPMIMWFSDAWIKNEPFDLACLRKNAKENAYSHDNFFHSVIGMMDMGLSLSTYDSTLDILAECRKP